MSRPPARQVITIPVDAGRPFEFKLRQAVRLLGRGDPRHFFVRLCATLFTDDMTVEQIAAGMEDIAYNARLAVPQCLQKTLGAPPVAAWKTPAPTPKSAPCAESETVGHHPEAFASPVLDYPSPDGDEPPTSSPVSRALYQQHD